METDTINIDDGYESDTEIGIQIIKSDQCANSNTDQVNDVNTVIENISVPYTPVFSSKKRLICFSIINNSLCKYNSTCTYAHSISEQKIDLDRLLTYQILFDKNLSNMKFAKSSEKIEFNEEIYKNLMLATSICNKCINGNCTGGYNCRNGICHQSIKICKSDFLSGDCVNSVCNIIVPDDIISKISFDKFEKPAQYIGCINGHHLTSRGLNPYYKYIHQKEVSKKKIYQSSRIINYNYSTFPDESHYQYNFLSSESDSSDDEEILQIFAEREKLLHVKNGYDNEDNEDNKDNNDNNTIC